MEKRLVIVESPTKAKTISKFLSNDFEVLASYGHVRDLPTNASEIPADLKKQKWSRLGVNVDDNFNPLYVVPADKEKRVNELKRAVKNASEVYLATDEDREGESISWHLLSLLNPKVPVKRLVFHEITKKAIEESLQHARTIDENLVRAQETRRIIDRLYGYSVSPLLWKKMVPRLSAGRVQSVAIRLLVQRERERAKFRSADFWDLKATFVSPENPNIPFDATLTHVGDKRVADGKDFDSNTGKLHGKSDVVLLDEAAATKLSESLAKTQARVSEVESKPFTQKPYAPFTTSTLQQEANRKLGFGAKRTMAVAQTLYENGFITYMRTDSTTLSEEALSAARSLISREFGPDYLSQQPRIYKTKVKNAQEAHEAIRPAGVEFTHPSVVKDRLGLEAVRLYELIWKRTLASQMRDAEGTRVAVSVAVDNATFKASGKTISFPGFLRAYVEGSDDPEGDLADQDRNLPPLKVGDGVNSDKYDVVKHSTQPPARFTEGSLIKELERLGIGRPSTWATIVDVVLSRDYAFKKGPALVPSYLAIGVTGLLEGYFSHLVDYEFTARLEDDLDSISRGELDNLEKLRSFYFGEQQALKGLKDLVSEGEQTIDPREVCGIRLGEDSKGRKVEVRIGRYGPFLSNGEDRVGVPDSLPFDELTPEVAEKLLAAGAKKAEALGVDPVTNLPVYFKTGRFGPYFQLGDMGEGGTKPKMASILPGMNAESATLELALQILALPKVIGVNSDNNTEVLVANGKFGPYVKCGTDSRSIPADESPLTISLERALELLKQPRVAARTTSQPKTVKELGKNPESGETIQIKNGRYGLYVTDGTINATLQQGVDPEAITLDEAISLIKARAERGPSKKKRGKRAPKVSAEEGGEESAKKPKKTSAKSTAKKTKTPRKKAVGD